MLQETSFHHIYFISDQNRDSKLLWHYLFQCWSEADVETENKITNCYIT